MKLLSCYVKNFGNLSDFSFSFTDGINTVCRENGFGKTTLSVFIKSMFYGLEDTRKQKLSENDRRHYMPWNKGVAGGYLIFSANGKNYRIERTFAPKAQDDTFALYNADSGDPCYDFSKNLGEELFEIDADGFERTLFLSEENLSGKNENKTISAKLSDLSDAVFDLGVMDDAVELLEKRRRAYQKLGGKGEISDIGEKLRKTNREIEELLLLKSDVDRKEQHLSALDADLQALYSKRDAILELEKQRIQKKTHNAFVLEYKKIALQLEAERANVLETSSFFSAGVPTLSQINEISNLISEKKRYEEAYASLAENETASSAPDTLEIENDIERGIELCEGAVEDYNVSAARLITIREEKEKIELERKSLFHLSPPTEAEINSHINKITEAREKKSNHTSVLLVVLGIFITILGISLGFIHATLFAIGIVGIALLVIGLALSQNGTARDLISANDAAVRFIKEIEGRTVAHGEIFDALFDIKIKTKRFSELTEKEEALSIEEEKARLSSEDAIKRARAILAKFSLPDSADIKAALSNLKERYMSFRIYSEEAQKRERSATEAKARVSELALKISEFFSKYPTKTDEPLFEIRDALMRRNLSLEAERRLSEDLKDFAIRHGIEPNDTACEIDEEEAPLETTLAVDERIAEIERQKILTDKIIREELEKLEALDGLTAEAERLKESEEKYKNELDIIKKTVKYLNEAKDSLTSKYLASTKAAFDKYISKLTDEECEDFMIGTSLEIRKNDGGTLRETESYSKGRRELYHLALRLALVDSLYTEEKPFIILDDPFAHFDDKKLRSALSLLSSVAKTRQIIYLSCTKSRT